MTAVILFLLIIAISFVIVRVGAVAFELTGMPWDQAKFQALSAFTNTGYTTREAERVISNPIRRRIATMLIVLGNAGLITLIGTFVSSIVEQKLVYSLLNLFLILLGVLSVVWVFHLPRVKSVMREKAKGWLESRYDLDAPSPNELLRLDDDYSLSYFTLSADSPAVGQCLRNLQLKQNGVQILAIERNGKFLAVPRGTDTIMEGDKVVLYGRRGAAIRLFHTEESEQLGLVESGEESPDIQKDDTN